MGLDVPPVSGGVKARCFAAFSARPGRKRRGTRDFGQFFLAMRRSLLDWGCGAWRRGFDGTYGRCVCRRSRGNGIGRLRSSARCIGPIRTRPRSRPKRRPACAASAVTQAPPLRPSSLPRAPARRSRPPVHVQPAVAEPQRSSTESQRLPRRPQSAATRVAPPSPAPASRPPSRRLHRRRRPRNAERRAAPRGRAASREHCDGARRSGAGRACGVPSRRSDERAGGAGRAHQREAAVSAVRTLRRRRSRQAAAAAQGSDAPPSRLLRRGRAARAAKPRAPATRLSRTACTAAPQPATRAIRTRESGGAVACVGTRRSPEQKARCQPARRRRARRRPAPPGFRCLASPVSARQGRAAAARESASLPPLVTRPEFVTPQRRRRAATPAAAGCLRPAERFASGSPALTHAAGRAPRRRRGIAAAPNTPSPPRPVPRAAGHARKAASAETRNEPRLSRASAVQRRAGQAGERCAADHSDARPARPLRAIGADRAGLRHAGHPGDAPVALCPSRAR